MYRQLPFSELVLVIEMTIASFHSGTDIDIKLLQERIYIGCQKLFFTIANQFLAGEEDLRDGVSDLFLWFFAKEIWKKYNPDKARFPTWIKTVIANKLVDDYRKRKVREHVDNPDSLDDDDLAVDVVDPNTPDPLTAVIDERVGIEIRRSFEKLPQKQREIATLVILRGYKLKDAAQMLQIPDSKAKNRLFHARKKLRRLLSSLYREMKSDE
jgi:RNA polymerase sigma factor (sigma-70 family)